MNRRIGMVLKKVRFWTIERPFVFEIVAISNVADVQHRNRGLQKCFSGCFQCGSSHVNGCACTWWRRSRFSAYVLPTWQTRPLCQGLSFENGWWSTSTIPIRSGKGSKTMSSYGCDGHLRIARKAVGCCVVAAAISDAIVGLRSYRRDENWHDCPMIHEITDAESRVAL